MRRPTLALAALSADDGELHGIGTVMLTMRHAAHSLMLAAAFIVLPTLVLVDTPADLVVDILRNAVR